MHQRLSLLQTQEYEFGNWHCYLVVFVLTSWTPGQCSTFWGSDEKTLSNIYRMVFLNRVLIEIKMYKDYVALYLTIHEMLSGIEWTESNRDYKARVKTWKKVRRSKDQKIHIKSKLKSVLFMLSLLTTSIS